MSTPERRYVFSVGIVPVQAWIAEALRSRDLRAGSALLSWLMAKLLVHLREELGAEAQIPREGEPGLFGRLAADEGGFGAALKAGYGIPNRASGFCLASGPRRTVEEVLPALEEDVLLPAWQAWKREFLLEPDTTRDSADFWQDLAPYRDRYEARVGRSGDCPFEVVWVAKPLDGSGSGVEDEAALREIDRLYADVKRSRPVDPWVAGAPVGKCGMCGKREAIGPSETFSAWRAWHRRIDRLAWVQRGWRVDPGERLCYVCLAKRMAAYAAGGEAFPSTGLVAAWPWLKAIETAGGAPAAALVALRRAVAAEGDGDLGRTLFSSASELRSQGRVGLAEAREVLSRSLGDRPRALPVTDTAAPLPRIPRDPPSYLALVVFDGDDMGAHVGRAPGEVSPKIAAFATEARELLTREVPGVFYLGGDEGLALLPASTALRRVVELREAFGRSLGDGITLSAGLVFFEQRRPLGAALDEARHLLKEAKSLEGKNALGVAVQTAAGTRWHLVEHWGATWERVAAAVGAVQDGRLAAGWAYDVEDFLESLDDATWAGLVRSPEPVRREVERLLVRRLIPHQGQGRHRRREEARQLWERLRGEELWTMRGNVAPQRHPEQFHLIGFLARQLGVEEVEGTPEEVEP